MSGKAESGGLGVQMEAMQKVENEIRARVWELMEVSDCLLTLISSPEISDADQGEGLSLVYKMLLLSIGDTRRTADDLARICARTARKGVL